MQVQLSRPLLRAWHRLPPEARRFIEALKQNPRPASALTFPERPGYYEEFIGGVWIGWLVDESTGETMVKVAIAEE